MNYRSISDLNQIILKRLYIIPRDIDLVVGIPRSGMFPANLLALYLNRPVTDLGSFINGHIYKAGERGQFFDSRRYKKILIVDDDENIAELVSLYLTKECFDTMMVHDGERALVAFDTYKPNCLLYTSPSPRDA